MATFQFGNLTNDVPQVETATKAMGWEMNVSDRQRRSSRFYAVCCDILKSGGPALKAKPQGLRVIGVRGQWGRDTSPRRFATVEAAQAYITDNQSLWAEQGVEPYVSRVTNLTPKHSWWMRLGPDQWQGGFLR